ncbi:hypothetical protein ACOSP6_06860 [Tenacibaculum sp. MEBiC06402]|uniref:hypothetical protein n=1 Tax=unclassified Tenacibaculum TaxID=2635139 RepID=UPI003B9C4E22
MDDISNIIKNAQDELFPELESRISAQLNKKDKDWLIDQIIYLTCERHSLHEQKEKLKILKNRIARITKKGFTDHRINAFIDAYKNTSRSELLETGFLINPPHLGLHKIETFQRSQKGEMLLEEACDILYAVLYGDTAMNIRIPRSREEILTIIIPESKSDIFNFLKAVTETKITGTWNDPEDISNDDHTNNIELQIEFSDTKDGILGTAAFVALQLINLLEINEQILYARLENIERSSL